MITRSDVARRAGVSVATVSNFVSKKKFVSPELALKVEKAIKELDYHPNLIARSLSTKKTYHVGIIVNNIANSYYGEIAQGMSQAARKVGYTVSIFFTGDNPEENVATSIQRNLDGLFIATNGALFTDDQVKSMLANDIVFVNCLTPGVGSIVTFDYGSAIRQMVSTLAQNGHRHIGFLSGMSKNLPNFIRYQSFLRALEEHHLPSLEQHIIDGEAPYRTDQWEGYQAMQKLLAASPRVTAVFCLNDLMAMGALKAIREAGLRVPEDISIIGCDDMFFDEFMQPALSTLRVPKMEMGKQAMLQLIRQMKGGEREDVVLEVEFIARDSIGKAPGSSHES